MIAKLTEFVGVCLDGKWKGWLFRKHPDGQWVSVRKLDEADPMEGSPFAALAPPPFSHLGWQTMDTAPQDGARFVAVEINSRHEIEYARVYKWEGPPNYWHCRREGVCIRPDYQERYRWMPLPALVASTERKSA
ncbi:hypothetical protein EV128_125143 [Rhizobium azibense]|nr:hypothetical protein EV128_125143 [Rhizobium azibense]